MELSKLVWRNLTRRPLRTLLTIASLAVAFFLMCTLRSLVTTLSAGVDAASGSRVVVQSAVSLFVDLPQSYQAKIAGVEGVAQHSKYQWFGGYYQEPRNRFAQFAIDADRILDVYDDKEIVEGSLEAFLTNRRGALIGVDLAEQFGFEVGETLPILPELYPHPDGPGVAWEFEVAAIYRSTVPDADERSMFFHFEYLEETLAAGSGESPGAGTYIVRLEPGADATAVMAAIDALFERGPQRVQATPESEFQRQFVTMFGSVPFFVGTIGGGVLIAILLAVVNTMLMAGREQTRDVGIMKALGFTDMDAVRVLVAQSMLIVALGASAGMFLAKAAESGVAAALREFVPDFAVEQSTMVAAAGIALVLGFVAGAAPAWRAARLDTVDAMGSDE